MQRDFTTADLAPFSPSRRRGLAPPRRPAALNLALKDFAAEPLLRGARHVVQAEPAGFLDRPDIDAGIRTFTRHGLAFDLLLRADQILKAAQGPVPYPCTPPS